MKPKRNDVSVCAVINAKECCDAGTFVGEIITIQKRVSTVECLFLSLADDHVPHLGQGIISLWLWQT